MFSDSDAAISFGEDSDDDPNSFKNRMRYHLELHKPDLDL